MSQHIRRYALYLHVLALLIVVAISAAMVLVPGGRAINAALNNSSISLSVDRQTVFAAGDCVRFQWRVEGVREVYLDDNPTVGEGDQQVCLQAETSPVLRVVLPDNSVNEYTIPVAFFIRQPAALFLALIAVIIVISFAALAILPRMTPVTGGATASTGCLQRGLMIIGVIALSVMAAVFVLEMVLRVVFTSFGTESDRISYVYTREQAAAYDLNVLALPFVEYALSPEREGHNALGYRGDEVDPVKPEGVYRIVALGDSSTYGATEEDESYPVWLERTLHDTYGLTNVEVINAGVHGYTTWHTFVNFAFRVIELDPDLVIFYQSVIDVTGRTANPNCYRGINPLRGLDPRNELASNYNEGTFSISSLYRYLTIRLGLEIDPAEDRAVTVHANIPCDEGIERTDAENVALNPPVYYERNIRSLIGVAQIHGIDVMLSTWAYPTSSTTVEPYWRDATNEHNEIVRGLADEYDLLFMDYAALAPTDPNLWIDNLHLNGDGSRQQAETYAAYLTAQNVIPTP